MKCPNCSTQMQLMQRYEVDIDYCPSCKGAWLDRGEIDKTAKIESSHIGYNKYHYNYDNDEYDNDYYYNNRRRKRGFFGDLFNF
ncbi:MAG: zf-TFIIB domain-containing protein [Nitrososphaeraceae archaeon]